jgi:DNA gyrase subunit A
MIVDQPADKNNPITTDALLPDEAVVVAVSENRQVCRWPADQGLEPARGRQTNLILAVPAQTRDTLYLVTTAGRAAIIPMHQIQPGAAPGEGSALSEFITLTNSEQIAAGFTLPTNGDDPTGFLFTVSRSGRVKRVALADLVAVRGRETVVMGFDNGDTLFEAFLTPGDGEVVLVSSAGQAIRFTEDSVRPMGLPAAGVMGMKLGDKDQLVGAGLVKSRGDLVIVTTQGFGKRTGLEEFPPQGRYGQGVIAIKPGTDSGPVAAAATVNVSDRVMLVTEKGNNKTVFVKSLPKAARTSLGKELIAVRGKDGLARLITLPG